MDKKSKEEKTQETVKKILEAQKENKINLKNPVLLGLMFIIIGLVGVTIIFPWLWLIYIIIFGIYLFNKK